MRNEIKIQIQCMEENRIFENKPNTQLYYYKTKKDLLKENVKKKKKSLN